MDRLLFFLLLLPLFCLFYLAIGQLAHPNAPLASLPPSSYRFSDIIAKKVRVIVDPVRVLLAETVANLSRKERPVCVLALHRDECQGPRIRSNERIGWQDRLCLIWRCLRAEGLAMRVQDCWAGSGKSPILLIDREGCTRESSMLSSPIYRPLNQSAHTLGWLTVRLPHLDHIHLSCAIKFCPLCESQCRAETPPTNCTDSEGRGGEQWWANELEAGEGGGAGAGQWCGGRGQEVDSSAGTRGGIMARLLGGLALVHIHTVTHQFMRFG